MRPLPMLTTHVPDRVWNCRTCRDLLRITVEWPCVGVRQDLLCVPMWIVLDFLDHSMRDAAWDLPHMDSEQLRQRFVYRLLVPVHREQTQLLPVVRPREPGAVGQGRPAAPATTGRWRR